MAGVPLNPDLPASYQIPGIYGYISLLGTGPTPQNKRVLFLGLKTSAGSATANVPVRFANEQDCKDLSGTGSEILREYKAFTSQGGQGAETWMCPLEISGTVQTRLIKIMAAPAAGVLGGNTSASSAGVMNVWICGYLASVTIANGDSFNTIASNLNAEILKIEPFLPCTTTVSTDTVTLTLRHATTAAQVLADLPIIVSFSNTAMAVAASFGTITFAGVGDGTGTGTTLSVTTQSVSFDPNGLTANQSAAALITAVLAANAFPATAAQTAPAAIVTMFYVNDRVVNRSTIATTDTTQTNTPAWGTVSTVSNLSLTTALTNINALPEAFSLWLVGALAEATSLGTLSSNIETQANGVNCKGQHVVFCSTKTLATAGAIPTSTTPALTASPRYFMGWCPASPQQEYELAARMAARIIAQDYLPQNYAGMTLTSDGIVPLLLPHTATVPGDSDVNAAMVSYYMTPLRANTQNQLTIISGRTTAKPGASIDVRFIWWGTIMVVDYFRDDIRSYLGGVLSGKSIKRYSAPVTANCVTVESVTDLCYGRMLAWDGLDFLDGAERLREYLAGAINSFLPSRIDINMPLAEPVPLEQVSIYMMQRA